MSANEGEAGDHRARLGRSLVAHRAISLRCVQAASSTSPKAAGRAVDDVAQRGMRRLVVRPSQPDHGSVDRFGRPRQSMENKWLACAQAGADCIGPSLPTIGNRKSALRRRGAPARYRENNACSPRGLTERSFSAPGDLARLSPRIRESATRFRLSWSRCVLPREALRWHRQGRSSSTGLFQAETLLLLGSWLPPVLRSRTAIVSPNFLRS